MVVVTSGNERMFPGQPLNILPAPEPVDLSRSRTNSNSTPVSTEGSN